MQPRRRIAKRKRIRTRIQLLPQGLCEIYYCSGGTDFSHMARASVGKEGSVWGFIIIYGRTQHVLFTGIWRRVYGKRLLSKRGNPLLPLHGLHFPISCHRCFICIIQQTFSLPPIPVWLGRPTQHKIMSLLSNFLNTHFRITIPIKGSSCFIHCKAWRHESESVKTMYLDATDILISYRALMVAQISAVNMEAE